MRSIKYIFLSSILSLTQIYAETQAITRYPIPVAISPRLKSLPFFSGIASMISKGKFYYNLGIDFDLHMDPQFAFGFGGGLVKDTILLSSTQNSLGRRDAFIQMIYLSVSATYFFGKVRKNFYDGFFLRSRVELLFPSTDADASQDNRAHSKYGSTTSLEFGYGFTTSGGFFYEGTLGLGHYWENPFNKFTATEIAGGPGLDFEALNNVAPMSDWFPVVTVWVGYRFAAKH